MADFFARIPERLKRMVDLDNRPNKEIAEVALWKEVEGHDTEVLRARIESKRGTLEALKSERDSLNEQISNVQADVEAMEDELATEREAQAEYAEGVDDILDALESASGEYETINLLAKESEIEDLARLGGPEVSPGDVVDDIRQRADERDDLNLQEGQLKYGR